MRPDDRLAALNASLGELSDTRTAVENLHREVQESRRTIDWLVRVCIILAVIACGAVSWTAYQQTVLDGKSAAIDTLVDQNRDNATRDAQNSYDLCVRLNRSRAVIEGVWAKVLAGRPDGAALLARVEAAEPLGRCPKVPPAGR
jgi:hypothetical protein